MSMMTFIVSLVAFVAFLVLFGVLYAAVSWLVGPRQDSHPDNHLPGLGHT